jgi:hypothetical protein
MDKVWKPSNSDNAVLIVWKNKFCTKYLDYLFILFTYKYEWKTSDTENYCNSMFKPNDRIL